MSPAEAYALIDLRRRQSAGLRAYNKAYARWQEAVATRRWWQEKPLEPRINDFIPEEANG